MSTQESYVLNGSTRFDFPHPVRVKSQLTVEVRPGNVVPPNEYEVVGYGPNATGVTVYWPGAPTDPSLELRITRFTEPARVTEFTDGTPVQPSALDAEFDNLFQLYVDMPNYVQLAEDWANEAEDTEVSDGEYSALHWSAKAEQWAEHPEDTLTDGGGYSAFHWTQKAQEWAENPEDQQTYDGGYSALHWSAKSEQWAENPEDQQTYDGGYSALHWSAKSQQWAENPEGELTDGGGYSAFHWTQKAHEWAENPEGVQTYDGGYSALHYSATAEAAADTAETWALQANQYKEDTSDLHQSVQNTVDQFESGYTGFDEDHGYDFGYITDETTYFDRDFGTIT